MKSFLVDLKHTTRRKLKQATLLLIKCKIKTKASSIPPKDSSPKTTNFEIDHRVQSITKIDQKH
jgi:hypothetical protein